MLLLPGTFVAISDDVVITVCFCGGLRGGLPEKKKIPRVQAAALKCAIISKLFHVRATLANELLPRELSSCTLAAEERPEFANHHDDKQKKML